MIPVLLCAYRPTYLHATLKWLKTAEFDRRYRLFVWDNGGAAEILRAAGLEWQCIKEDGGVRNVGKALAMRHLVDGANAALPGADCYVCIDDDIAVDPAHLDAIVAAARRDGFGMVAAHMHPFNSVVPPGGKVTAFDPCPSCSAPKFGLKMLGACSRCGGSGKDPAGLRLRTYPVENRTVHRQGQVAGGLFAVSKSALKKLAWAPYLYPILTNDQGDPVPYWTEDASLDHGLTVAGLINGYLESAAVAPAIHLPDLDPEFAQWKEKARKAPRATPVFVDPLT